MLSDRSNLFFDCRTEGRPPSIRLRQLGDELHLHFVTVIANELLAGGPT